MKYAAAFLVFAAAFAVGAARLGGVGWALLYPAVSFGVIGLAYLGVGPRVFAKRADGSRPIWATVLLGPFLLFIHAVWHVDLLLNRRRLCDEVAPGIWLGRRPWGSAAVLPAGVKTVVDLTAEFCPPRAGYGDGIRYVCLPTLDASACDERCFDELVESLASHDEGGILIHCAQGRGRSAAVAAALLIRRGAATNAADAEALLRRARPEVGMNGAQRRLVDRYAVRRG